MKQAVCVRPEARNDRSEWDKRKIVFPFNYTVSSGTGCASCKIQDGEKRITVVRSYSKKDEIETRLQGRASGHPDWKSVGGRVRCDAMRCDSRPLLVTAPPRFGELEGRLGRFETCQDGGEKRNPQPNRGPKQIIRGRLRELSVELCILACEDAVCVGCCCFATRRIPILFAF